MNLTKALRLGPGDVVAIVGAGGKTSCMRRIMHEQADRSWVIASTTTNLGRDEADLALKHIVVESSIALVSLLSDLEDVSGTLFSGPLNAAGDKWTGLAESSITLLAEKVGNTDRVLLVEADGARRKLFKAPAEHEPAIPSEATLVVPIVNIGVLGQALSGDVVHRPERMARLLGIREGSPLEPEHIAQFMRHKDGGLKNVSDKALVRIFINGIDTEEQLEDARFIAKELGDEPRISSVLMGSIGDEDPVREVWGRTGIVILGAGGSSRFGAPKLVEHWQGKGILRQVVEKVLAPGIEPVVLVLGADYEQVSQAIVDLPIQIIHNSDWVEGQSTSVKAGLRAVEDRCEALIFVLGDMPAIEPGIIENLITTHRETFESVIAPQAGGRLGNPVLFDRRTFSDLMNLEGDRGGRALFDRYPPYPIEADEGVLFDIDAQEDLE
jgi:molybdenum cofactor cytidylyltransferase